MFKWIKKLFLKDVTKVDDCLTSESNYAKVNVWFDKDKVFLQWPDKKIQSIEWIDLIGVAVETTDEGPYIEDVWWHLATKDFVMTYPSEAKGANELLIKLQEIPTFNNETLTQMSSTSNQMFLLWDHEGKHNQRH